MAAIRSSSVEEDGVYSSYAGMYETLLGVTECKLDEAVRVCFGSKFDERVLLYNGIRSNSSDDGGSNNNNSSGNNGLKGGFAVVIMEMVNSITAGVAFSANPLNSDRDEIVIDSSYGLGVSVVDGSVTADRYVYNKIRKCLVDQFVGKKMEEKRLKLLVEDGGDNDNDGNSGGGIENVTIDDVEKQNTSSLSMEQVKGLVKMVEIVENEYDTPMDIEWAYYDAGGEQQEQQLVLLQARPITTLFTLDANMMTLPNERRILYYDFNIASEATTTSPFTRMDMAISNEWMNMGMGLAKHTDNGGDDCTVDMLLDDPSLPLFKSSTRQYINMSFFFKFTSTQFWANEISTLDPHLASLFKSKDCDRKRYRSKKRWPKQCSVRNAFWLLRKLPLWKWYRVGKRFQNDPERAKLAYIQLVERDMAKVKALQQRGLQRDEDGRGLKKFSKEICQCCLPSFDEEIGVIYFVVLGTFNTLDKKRRDSSASEQVRAEYDALCSGYDGDELMKINIDMYRLANKLDADIWKEYGHDELQELAVRIQQNLDGTVSDLPNEFLTEWSSFMDQHGYDGVDQLFISSPRYQDKPELLLTRLRQNVGPGIKDPAIVHNEQMMNRRKVMDRQLEGAGLFQASRIRKRNEILDHVMWIRNAPKLHFARMIGVLREAVLQIENELIEARRLQNKGDIFHLDLEEVDEALADETIDLIQIITPRKAVYERALEATECPLLVDSRCRILRPDPPNQDDVGEGTLIGTAVSPGVATGRVRILKSPNEPFESGEILAATVTSPAWTPLFVGASGVILQIGGVLQHGALCAREYGKPAVSNIDIHNVLKTGMFVEVDGNSGIVKIIEREMTN